jgi:hypothetical protein
MPQSDDEQKTVIDWKDLQNMPMSDFIKHLAEAVMKQAQVPSKQFQWIPSAYYHCPAWRTQRLELKPFPKRPAPVQVVMDKYQTLHAHFMRGLISSDDIGGLLDACSLELVEAIERHKDEYKNYSEPCADNDIVWTRRFHYDYGYRDSNWIITSGGS